MTDARNFLGKRVTVTVERPIGSVHPRWGFTYPVNYGFVPGTHSGDGDELNAYVLGITDPVETFEGIAIAIVRRLNEDDDKLIVVPDGAELSDEDIEQAVTFQEQWHPHAIIH